MQNLEDASQFAGPQTPDVGGFGGIEPTIGDVGGTFGTPTTEFSFDLGSDTGTTTGTETTTETGTGPGIRPDTGTTTAIDFGIDTVTETETGTPTERRFPNIGRGREAEERLEAVVEEREEDGFAFSGQFNEASDLEDTGILSADEVRRLL